MYCMVDESVMYPKEAQVRCQYSAAGPRSPCASGPSLNPRGSSLASADSPTAPETQTTVSLPTVS